MFKKAILALYFILTALFLPTFAYADDCVTATGVQIKDCFGFGGVTSFGQIISALINPTFSIITALVIIYFLWGAFKFLISGSNKEEVAGARQMITHAIIGFIILIFVFFILQFLLSSLFNIKDYELIK